MKRFCVLVVFLVGLAAALTSCGPSWKVGDLLVSEREIELVQNWNEPSILKTISCHLHDGENVEVIEGFQNLYCGSSCTETTMAVTSLDRENCSGWVKPGNLDDFRRP